MVASGATAPHPPAGEPGTGPQVSFARSAVSAPWGAGYPALLEFAEACDVPDPVGVPDGGLSHLRDAAAVRGRPL